VREKKFPYYPIFLDIEDRDVVIIGGGPVCERKAETMMRYGARVTVVSPNFTPAIESWASGGKLRIRRKPYDAGDLDGASIVIASTDDEAVNTQIATDCRKRKIPVNVVDVTHLCEFIVPAIVEQGSIQHECARCGICCSSRPRYFDRSFQVRAQAAWREVPDNPGFRLHWIVLRFLRPAGGCNDQMTFYTLRLT